MSRDDVFTENFLVVREKSGKRLLSHLIRFKKHCVEKILLCSSTEPEILVLELPIERGKMESDNIPLCGTSANSTMKLFRLTFLLFVLLGVGLLQAQEIPPLKVISFIPSDCKPFDKTDERLGRVMKHVQDFFRDGMDANGFGKKTFELEWAAPGKQL